MKRSFFQAAIVSILLYGYTTWKLNKRREKKLDGNYTRMLWAIMNRSWSHPPHKAPAVRPLITITKTIQIRQTIHAGHYCISNVFPWSPSHGRAKTGRTARTYIQQLCKDTGCSPEDLPEAMNDRERWGERVRDDGMTRRWWVQFLQKKRMR